MRYSWKENNGYINVVIGFPLGTRFCNLVKPEVYKGKSQWKLALAFPSDCPELIELKDRLTAWGEERAENYRMSIPAPDRHKARTFKAVRDTKMWKVEMRAPDDQSEAVPTGFEILQAKSSTRNKNGPKTIPVKNRDGDDIKLKSELPWDSKVLVELSFGTYGMVHRAQDDGPPMENCGVTCYLGAVRVLALGQGGVNRGLDTMDDDLLAAAMAETEGQAAEFGDTPSASGDTETDEGEQASSGTEFGEDVDDPETDGDIEVTESENPEWAGY